MKRCTVVIPCYNEEPNIPLILERFAQVLDDSGIEILLVDNGSTDNSEKVIRSLLPSYKFARSLHLMPNRGYGGGILAGLQTVETPLLGWTHADMQTDPYDVVRAVRLMEEAGTDDVYVKGKRRGRPLFDVFFTAGMSLFESVYMGRRLQDINAQPNIFPLSFFQQWENAPDDFALDLYALYVAQKKGLDVIRFPVTFPPRIHGSSKWNTGMASKWKFIKRTVAFSIKLKRSL